MGKSKISGVSFSLKICLRYQSLKQDRNGHIYWQVIKNFTPFPTSEAAILICDMWDKHWSGGASERVEAMAPRMNEVVKQARENGVQIIHSPSETMEFYAGAPARKRMLEVARVAPPIPSAHDDPPLPIDDSNGGSDTGEKPWYKAWSRQHPAIEIDQEKDGISDDGVEIYSFIQSKGIRWLIIMGVYTNINRSFGIKQMVRWGMNVVLVRDLTDAMYNPAMRPYVSHEEGTRLVVEYIEKFWCPTVLSNEIENIF
ncbi:MAG: isochorismatase family protein [Thermoproteota archaeon]